jgi:5-formyltetrahydrofolate cyclo-ligase
LRQLRRAIGPAERNRCGRRAALHLLRWRPLLRARRIAVYLSVHSELSTAALIRGLHRLGRSPWVPVSGRGGGMRFAPLRKGAKLGRDALGLPRPLRARPLRSARTLDLMILPLLGFDRMGHRLGNGGGYYDRALAGARRGGRPLLVGYAYAAQKTAEVPAEPWDVRLDAVVTERGLRRCR